MLFIHKQLIPRKSALFRQVLLLYLKIRCAIIVKVRFISNKGGFRMSESRTRNSMLNLISALVGQILSLVLKFVVQTVFIYTLGKEYLGLNGLFTNILSFLSLAELGVGSSITFCCLAVQRLPVHHCTVHAWLSFLRWEGSTQWRFFYRSLLFYP